MDYMTLKMAPVWLIPKYAAKPTDRRYRSAGGMDK